MKPQVFALIEPFARVIAADAAGAFEMVGPWSDLSAAEAAQVRVAFSSGIDRFDADLLAQLSGLQEIVVFGAGQSGIDLAETTRRGIRINAAGATHAGDVAEHGVAMILALRRNLLGADSFVRSGAWASGRMPSTRRLAGSRVGIVGLGHIGRECARRLDALGCDVRWWGPNPKPDAGWPRAESLLDLAQTTQILVIAAFAHDETRHLIGQAEIDALGPDGLLVNLSRGFVVDEDALIAALRDGRLGQAALDVFETEPTPPQRWADVPNLLLSPHSAGDTVESILALRQRAVREIAAALER
ncbi:NAD(P)-dependent oxidoreductase [Sphingomonas jatrophae]|uniref:Lactate dehydrogenase n=1 Tax=Sphingomonas jatrophae TaxID=1166337 RepID=A0A1I6KF58_9SPHN|nr:NAD(P)-dependent oxidoreductase [Sphingomonas jatrophae]SFR89885.1 Lactate dehydrogenase [Sphingomonas jatrophae]